MAEVVKLVIRRSLFVNPCSSVLEQHNELKRAAGCQRVNADLGCKALQELKRTRNVQGPTRSTDAVKKSPNVEQLTSDLTSRFLHSKINPEGTPSAAKAEDS